MSVGALCPEESLRGKSGWIFCRTNFEKSSRFDHPAPLLDTLHNGGTHTTPTTHTWLDPTPTTHPPAPSFWVRRAPPSSPSFYPRPHTLSNLPRARLLHLFLLQLCASSDKFGGETNFETVAQQQEKAGGAFGLLEQEWKLLDKDNSGTLDLAEVRKRGDPNIGRRGHTRA